jgi:hypothetical protein
MYILVKPYIPNVRSTIKANKGALVGVAKWFRAR